jgi:PAS domain S-box-containing protein
MSQTPVRFGVLAALVLGCGLPLTGSGLAHILLAYRRWNQGPLHSALEALGMFAGLTLATLLLSLRRYKASFTHHLWTACGLIGMGVLDGFHAACLPGNTFVWFRGTATLLGGVCFALVWLPEPVSRWRWGGWLPVLFLLGALLLGGCSAAWPEALPALLAEGRFTTAARLLNTLGGLTFLAAAAWFLIRYHRLASIDDFLFASFSLLFGMAGILFWTSRLWDADWWWWHFLRLAAYLLVLGQTFLIYQRDQEELHTLNRSLEQKVAERTARVRAILDTAVDAIITIDERGVVESLNPAAERLFGYPACELIGQNVKRLMPAPYREEHDRSLGNYLATGRKRIIGGGREVVGLRKDGTTFPMELTVSEVQLDARRLFTGIVRDISERKRAEAASREQEFRVRAILDHAFQFIGMLSPEGILLEGNRTALQFAGVEAGAVIGKPFWETPWWSHSVEMQDRLRAAVARAAAGEFIRFEATHPGPTGRLHYVDFSLSPVTDSAGNVVMLIPEGRDITERKRTEQQEAVQHALTRILAEADSLQQATSRILQTTCEQLNWALGALFVVDRAEGVLRCLQTWHAPQAALVEFADLTHRIVFLPGVGVPGRVWASRLPVWVPDVCSDPHFPRLPAAVREGIHAALAFPIIVDDEVSGVIEFFSTDMRQEERDLLGRIGALGNQIGQFIQRKRAEEDLRKAKEAAEAANVALRERVRLLELGTEIGLALVRKTSLTTMLQRCAEALVRHLDGAFARIWTLSASGETLELQASAGMYTHLDGPHGKVAVGKYKIGLIARECKPHLTNQVVGDPRVSDQEWARREGMVAFAGHPLIVEGGLLGVVAMFARHALSAATLAALGSVADLIAVGISRKRTEEALVRSELEAQAANRAKSEFLASMSHEIRTPMNGVLGMTRLALDTELPPRQREYLDMAHRSAESLLDILNDILDFSKIEAGKLTLDAVPFSVREWVGDVVRDMAIRAHARNLELTCELDSEVPDALTGDPGRLRQVLLNLVSNAIKFTDEGEVDLRVQRVSGTNGDVELQFSVRDTGSGIPPDRLDRIFEAFEQADTSITRTHGGTGLGLTISARLVAMMGGALAVESAVGVGSTFHFRVRFPLADQPVQRRPPHSLPELAGLRVLIVDDNATNRRILHDMLSHWDMRPHCVASGAEAVQAMREAAAEGTPFPLVLLDARMPEMDGFAVAEKLQGNRAYDGATIMMLSSADHQADVVRCRSIGIQSYLIKPVVPSVLFNAILEALDKFNGLIASGAPADLGSPARRLLEPNGDATPETATSATTGRLHILLAEDNLINQKVAIGTLEAVGHQVTVVNNGKEAVAALEKQAFDVVLMDVQMPEMDGFQATAAIREGEKRTRRHTPIIALTARAMKGDQDRCLAAGMDEYVSKPIRPEELLHAIGNCVSPGVGARDKASPGRSDDESPLNQVALLARVGGNVALLTEILEICPGEFARLAGELEIAVSQKDAKRIELAAHTLKGTLGNLSAAQAYEAALHLEDISRKGDLERLEEAFRFVQEQLQRVKQAVARLHSDLTAC